MTPRSLQHPSEPLGASHTVCAGPPAIAIFLSLPSAKNPR